MSISPQAIRTSILTLFAIGALVTFLLEWPFSPLNRTLAWYNLQAGNFANVEEATALIHKITKNEAPVYGTTIPFLTLTDTLTETVETPDTFATTFADDDQYPIGQSYLYPIGQMGLFDLEYHTLSLNGRDVYRYTATGKILSDTIHPKQFNGKKDVAELETLLLTHWKLLSTSLSKNDSKTATALVTTGELPNFAKTTKLSDLSYRTAAKATIKFDTENEEEQSIQVGTITLVQSNCSIVATIPIIYVKESREYRFSGVYTALASLCAKPKPSSGVLSCSNCWLAPVSKQFSLPSTYAPYTVKTGLNGGGSVTPDTKTALSKLFADAKSNGISKIRVSSSYRSYNIQNSLFNSYVQSEKNGGLSEAQAIAKANTYSAKPGQSEHQLGTTVDIVACDYPCSLYDSANATLTSYLLKNAHKFGFVISYPNGSQQYTGYVYEPWHIRYIGVDNATELFKRGYLTKKGFYLYQYLLEKGKY